MHLVGLFLTNPEWGIAMQQLYSELGENEVDVFCSLL